MCQLHLSLLCQCSWITKNPKISPHTHTNWLKCTDVSEPYPATYIEPLSLWCSLHRLLWAGLSLGCVFDLYSFCCGTFCLYKIWRPFLFWTRLLPIYPADGINLPHLNFTILRLLSLFYVLRCQALQGRYTIISIGICPPPPNDHPNWMVFACCVTSD